MNEKLCPDWSRCKHCSPIPISIPKRRGIVEQRAMSAYFHIEKLILNEKLHEYDSIASRTLVQEK